MFESAYLKLKRSQHHIDELDALLRSYGDSGAYEFFIDRYSDPVNDFVVIRPVNPIPDTARLILGDAIQNLKSALDHAWNEITARHIGIKNNKFPGYPRRDLYVAHFANKLPQTPFFGKLHGVFLDTIQPYVTGQGEAIYILHDLARNEGHAALIPQIHVNTLEQFFVEDEKGKKYGITSRTFGGKQTLRLGGKYGKLKVINEGRLTFTIIFGKGTMAKGRLIMPTLREFKEAVTRTLETLEPFA